MQERRGEENKVARDGVSKSWRKPRPPRLSLRFPDGMGYRRASDTAVKVADNAVVMAMLMVNRYDSASRDSLGQQMNKGLEYYNSLCFSYYFIVSLII